MDSYEESIGPTHHMMEARLDLLISETMTYTISNVINMLDGELYAYPRFNLSGSQRIRQRETINIKGKASKHH